MLQDVVLSVRGRLEQGPALQRLKPDLVGQLLEDVLGRVLGMDVQGLGSTVQEEEPADDGAETLHRLKSNKSVSYNFYR